MDSWRNHRHWLYIILGRGRMFGRKKKKEVKKKWQLDLEETDDNQAQETKGGDWS